MAIYRVPISLTWPGAGSPGVNVWHVRTISDAIDPLNAALAALQTFYNGFQLWFAQGTVLKCPDYVSTALSAAQRAAGEQPEFTQVPTPWTITSTGTGAAPAPVAVTATWYTSNATRRGRGRTFISPLQKGASQDNGTPDDVMIGAINTAATTLINDSNDNLDGWAVGVWSSVDGVLRDTIRHKVRDQFAVLRSRRD